MFLFDVGTGARRPVTTQSEGLPPDILGLNGMATSADSRYVAISGVARTWVVDTQTHREVFSRKVDGPDWVALSADGRRVVTGGGSVEPLSLWDVASGRLLRQFDTKQVFWFGFSLDERTLASFGRDGVVRLWDVATGHETTSLRGHAAGGTWASLSSDGTRLASFAGDDSVRVWTLHARGEVATFPLGAGFYAGGSLDIAGGRAAVGVDHGGAAVGPHPEGIVFDPSTGAVQTRIPGVTGQVIRLSPDGRQLAAQQQVAAPTLSRAAVDGPVLVHDLATGKVTSLEGFCVYSEAVSAANPQCKKAPSTPFKAWVFSMEFSPDGSLLAVGSEHGGGLSVWNTKTRKLLFHTDRPSDDLWSVAFSPDGRRLVAATLGELIVYDTDSWQRIVRRSFGAVGVRFSPDGRYIIGVSTTGAGIEIVDARTWRRRATLVGLQGQVKDLDISADGTMIASADFSGLVRIWDLPSGKPLQDIPFANVPIQNAKFLDDRHLLVTPANGPEVVIVTLDVDELLRIARSRLTRAFTQEECRTYLHVDTCPSS
jgi:WD40 repeat protein